MRFEKLTRSEVETRVRVSKPRAVVSLASDAQAFGADERDVVLTDVDPETLASVRAATAAYDLAHDNYVAAVNRPRSDHETAENRVQRLQRLHAAREQAWRRAVAACEQLMGVSAS